MQPPSIAEVLALWIIINVVVGFFIGFKKMGSFQIMILTFILFCIVAGFFMSFGNEIYLWMLYPQG
jgi:hypothetical protein